MAVFPRVMIERKNRFPCVKGEEGGLPVFTRLEGDFHVSVHLQIRHDEIFCVAIYIIPLSVKIGGSAASWLIHEATLPVFIL